MSILDWSDPDEMLGLLTEYIRDELAGAVGDRERARFLRALAAGVESLSRAAPSAQEAIRRLRQIGGSQPPELAADPALIHIQDCVEELERIVAQSQAPHN